jgi:O-succinylbenzoic acid--CoA ligase
LFRCLEAGATMLLHRRFDPLAVAADMADGKATHVSLVPAMLGQLLDLGCRPSPRLRHVLVGGAGLPLAMADQALAAGWPIHPSYGMSEAASQVATCGSAIGWRPGLAGEPLAGIEIATSPDGRIRVRGPSVMAGYVNAGLNPGDGLDADGWFETGDLGGLDVSGCLHVLGRADDVLVSGGEKLHPTEVEGLAGRCPGVHAIGVTGKTDANWGDLVVAVVVGEVTEPAFLDWCRTHLPSHLRPRRMLSVGALPLTAGGKIDRQALRRMANG